MEVNHQHLICRWRSPSIPSSILLFVFVGTVGNDQVLRIHHWYGCHSPKSIITPCATYSLSPPYIRRRHNPGHILCRKLDDSLDGQLLCTWKCIIIYILHHHHHCNHHNHDYEKEMNRNSLLWVCIWALLLVFSPTLLVQTKKEKNLRGWLWPWPWPFSTPKGSFTLLYQFR